MIEGLVRTTPGFFQVQVPVEDGVTRLVSEELDDRFLNYRVTKM